MEDKALRLLLGSEPLDFVATPLTQSGDRVQNLFVRKNNRTVRETISHPKYSKLARRVESEYPQSLDMRRETSSAASNNAGICSIVSFSTHTETASTASSGSTIGASSD